MISMDHEEDDICGVPERPKLVSCSWMAVSRLPVFQTCALC
ncbi:hypothetical protein LINPERHAP1_LOCUS22431 [Linum perenne]